MHLTCKKIIKQHSTSIIYVTLAHCTLLYRTFTEQNYIYVKVNDGYENSNLGPETNATSTEKLKTETCIAYGQVSNT